jgi:hypothetical protein
MYLDLSVYLTVIPFNVAGMSLHQQTTVKRELINEIEQWQEHIADVFD